MLPLHQHLLYRNSIKICFKKNFMKTVSENLPPLDSIYEIIFNVITIKFWCEYLYPSLNKIRFSGFQVLYLNNCFSISLKSPQFWLVIALVNFLLNCLCILLFKFKSKKFVVDSLPNLFLIILRLRFGFIPKQK
jgi:hypothetical protein